MLVALVVIAGVGSGGYYAVVKQKLLTPVAATTRQAWFAPYVDVTLTPTFQFQELHRRPGAAERPRLRGRRVEHALHPELGSVYSLDQASQVLAMGPRIAQLQQEGQQAIVSFGGKANTSLDVACPTADALTAAYRP